MIPISFEFFPPKTPEGRQKLAKVRERLVAYQPQFCSVTYGAGGSTQQGTFDTVHEILAEGQEAASHFSCIGATQSTVITSLQTLQTMGVKRLVALRGDLPSGYGLGGAFQYASDLVAFVRQHFGDAFHLEVAAYPEMHPQAKSPQSDLQALARKVEAGANSAITQYFYNPDAYFQLLDEAQTLGLSIPIVPGIMPITNCTQLLRFSEACGAEVPRWIKLRLQSYGDDAASIKAFGHEVVAALCERLIQGGVPSLHFYTLNQAEPTAQLLQHLGLVPSS